MAAAVTAAAASASSTVSEATRDGSLSQENRPVATKSSRYRSLREKSVSSTASAGDRLLGNTTNTSISSYSTISDDNSMSNSISNNISNGISNLDDDKHHRGSVDSGRQQQQQRQSSTLGDPISRSMSMSRYRRRANNVFVSGDATQTAPKVNADPPRPAYVDNPPRGVVVPPAPTIPRALRRRSSGSSGSGRSSSNRPFVPGSRCSSTRRTEQKEEEHLADTTKGSLDLPSPPSSSSAPAPVTPPGRRRLRHTSNANSRGHDIVPLRRRMEMTMESNQSPSQGPSRPSTAAGDENQQRRKMIDLDERRRKMREEQERATNGIEGAARLEAETHRLLAEQKRKDLERLQVQLANSHQATVSTQKAKSPVIEKFAFLSKVRKHKNELSPLSPGLSPTASSASASISEFHRTPTMDSTSARVMPTGIEAGGRGIVPQTDAPASAINSGDRTVTVRCRHHTFNLVVTPETTTADILTQTSKQMTYDLEISSSTCVVVESYIPLGLERRLRRYEHIRDVMNSWDQDTQNCLVVTVSRSGDDDQDLDIASVPNLEQPPQGFQLYMYHSNRPGKWNKRWVTLLENGQIICSKKANTQPNDKDASSLCRLSDYDMYTPTESQMRRHLKPPKKHCFAIKSQQKTAVFMNTENFVQLFCTEDPNVADKFRQRVQGWRSWYLVDRRPEARKKASKVKSESMAGPAAATSAEEEGEDGDEVPIPKVDGKAPQIILGKPTPTAHKSVNVASVNGHRLKVSVDESPYAIGEFEPLLDMKRFDKRLSQFGQDFLPTPAVPDVSTMPKGLPAHVKQQQQQHARDGSSSKAESQKQQRNLIDTIKSPDGDSAGFTGGGLLGEGYEERRQPHTQAGEDGEGRWNHTSSSNGNSSNNYNGRSRSSTATNVTVTEGPFTDGNTLLNRPPPLPASTREPGSPASPKPDSPSWFPSALEHSAKQRTTAKHQTHHQQQQRHQQQFQRPSTSAGVVQSSSLSSSSRRPSLPFQHGGHGGGLHARPPTASGGGGSGSFTNGDRGSAAASHPNPLRSSPYLSSSSGAMSHSNRRERPKPLVNIDGNGNGDLPPLPPPQWREKSSGRGVIVPEGMNHIIDLISVSSSSTSAASIPQPPSSAPPTRHHHHRHPAPPALPSQQRYHSNNNHLHHHNNSSASSNGGAANGYLVDKIPSAPPPRSALRNASGSGSGNGSSTPTRSGGAPHSAPLPLSRTRSKTTGAPPPVSLRTRSKGGGDGVEVPPLPPLPAFAAGGGGASSSPTTPSARVPSGGRGRDRDRDKERNREYREREAAFNSVPGRTGTLKVV